MKIQQSTVSMSGTHMLTTETYSSENLKMWVGSRRPDFEGKDSLQNPALLLQDDRIELSEEALKLKPLSISEEEYELSISDRDEQKITLLKKLLEKLTGKKFKFYGIEKIKLNSSGSNPADISASLKTRQRQGWGMEYDFHQSYIEKEKMSFNSTGVVKTEDGREISFSVQLSMSREFASQQDIHIRAGDAALVDPLVINLKGSGPGLSDSTFSFDLDCDGDKEQIHRLSSSCGFLALDLNNDGIINDGRELFGPTAGDGFKELSVYDADSNGWIDENDPVFDKLRVWTKDEDGVDRLFALGVKGVGAIYVGNINTDFAIKDNSNTLVGQVRKTGIFLNENGTAGTIQHIDLVV